MRLFQAFGVTAALPSDDPGISCRNLGEIFFAEANFPSKFLAIYFFSKGKFLQKFLEMYAQGNCAGAEGADVEFTPVFVGALPISAGAKSSTFSILLSVSGE